ncbi:hypothetical protein CTZ27_14065 [Streptomyces griseocarneus]|nr:hypothetical protein CTZ27_14065 [Streptomyces griseocarneus]
MSNSRSRRPAARRAPEARRHRRTGSTGAPREAHAAYGSGGALVNSARVTLTGRPVTRTAPEEASAARPYAGATAVENVRAP